MMDDSENGKEDVNGIIFTAILSGNNPDTEVNLTKPDGGENFEVGTYESMRWNMGDKQ